MYHVLLIAFDNSYLVPQIEHLHKLCLLLGWNSYILTLSTYSSERASLGLDHHLNFLKSKVDNPDDKVIVYYGGQVLRRVRLPWLWISNPPATIPRGSALCLDHTVHINPEAFFERLTEGVYYDILLVFHADFQVGCSILTTPGWSSRPERRHRNAQLLCMQAVGSNLEDMGGARLCAVFNCQATHLVRVPEADTQLALQPGLLPTFYLAEIVAIVAQQPGFSVRKLKEILSGLESGYSYQTQIFSIMVAPGDFELNELQGTMQT